MFQETSFFDWIKEKIQSSDDAWRVQFVKTITENDVLSPGVKIRIQRSWREDATFEIHTCFNFLDVPPGIIAKNGFLEALNATIQSGGYNIA